MKKNKMWLILIPVVLVVLGLIGTAGVLLVQNQRTEEYSGYIMQAQRYVEAQDYVSALSEYQKAIDLDKSKTTAYEGMALIYQYQGDADGLETILRLYEQNHDGDITLRDKFNELLPGQVLETLPQDASQPEVTMEQLVEKQVSTEVELDTGVLSFLAGATYSDYTKTYGEASVERNGNTSVLRYQSAPLVCTYEPDNGSLTVDSATGKPYSESRPTSIQVTDLAFLLPGMTGETTLETLQADPALQGARVAAASDGGTFVTFETGGCAVTIAADASGTISGPDAWNEIRVTGQAQDVDQTQLSGKVVSATTGLGVSEPKLKFRQGLGAQFGSAVAECAASQSGAYQTELPPGDYTVEISAPGYITEYFDISIHSWLASEERDFVISPELDTGEIRIVLEWGSFPRDLDSYLMGTSSSGRSVNINFTNKAVAGVADLDVDCTSGYGPETTTVYDTGGSYQFVVTDYLSTGSMAQSGATVKVYQSGSSQPTVISVPSDVDNHWLVFSLQGGQLTVENRPYNGGGTFTGY